MILENGQYSFDASASEVRILGSLPDEEIVRIIHNKTRGVLLYSTSPGVIGKNAVFSDSGADKLIELEFDTSAFDDADILEIHVCSDAELEALQQIVINTDWGIVDTNNSSISPLGSSGVFTGSWTSIEEWGIIMVSAKSNQDSAAGGLTIEFSRDGIINDGGTDSYTISANQLKEISFNPAMKYYRVKYTNGAVAQGSFVIQAVLKKYALPNSHRVDEAISDETDAQLVKSVSTGKTPNGPYNNFRTQGNLATNSTSALLNANSTYRGSWFKWQENFVAAVSDLKSDVAGTFYFDFSQEIAPVNGSDVSVSDSIVIEYNPLVEPLLRRTSPIQSLWFRIRYINGSAAQSSFSLDTALLVSASPIPMQPLSVMPTKKGLAGLVRSVIGIPNAAGTGYREWPVDSLDRPYVSVGEVLGEVKQKAPTTSRYNQVNVGTTPVRIDLPLANRLSVMFKNHNLIGDAYWGYDTSLTESNGFLIAPRENISLDLSDARSIYVVARNTGGMSSNVDKSPVNSTGSTATNPNNAFASDNTYTTIGAAAIVENVGGFTAYVPGVGSSIQSVQIGMEASKQSGQTETVSFIDVQTGATSGAGNVSTVGTFPAANNQLYIADISRNTNTGSVTAVSGGGLTWIPALQNIQNGNRRIDRWYAFGSPASSFNVTASLSSSTNAHIAVNRFANADPTTPIQASSTNTGTGTAVTATGLSGTNKGFAVQAISHTAASGTAGAGYTERSDETNGSGSNTDSLSTETKPLVSTGTETGTYTVATSSSWIIISSTITPAPANDPILTMSYTLSGVPGATTKLVTLSSSTDSVTIMDITSDRSWVAGDMVNVRALATGTTIGGAAALIDQMFLRIVESTGNIVKIGISEIGR